MNIGIDFSKDGDKGAISILRDGTHYVLTLPEGYDHRTRVMHFQGRILVAHPDFKICEIKDDNLIPINFTR